MRDRSARIQPTELQDLPQPAFIVRDGHLTINGESFVLDKMPIETLKDLLGRADWEVEQGAYTSYFWETLGVHAMVGYTKNVQFLYLWYEPKAINEQFDISMLPFPGSMLIEGYEAKSSPSFYAWEQALDNHVFLHSFHLPGFSIRSSPCDLSIEMTPTEESLQKITMRNRDERR